MPSVAQKASCLDDSDALQPFYFECCDMEEGFYDRSIPGNEIWKKFELLPTPPRSPRRDDSWDSGAETLDDATMEKLVTVSDILDVFDLDPSHDCFLRPSHGEKDCEKCSQMMQDNLIQDCMWSTTWGGLKVDTNSNAEKKPSKPCSDDSKSNALKNARTTNCSSNSNVVTDMSLPNPCTDCVDPAAVFTYAVPDPKVDRLGTETPSDSEEEIDVVTVGDKKQPVQAQRVPQSQVSTASRSIVARGVSVLKIPSSSSMNATVAAMHNYTQTKESKPRVSLVTLHSSQDRVKSGVKRTAESSSIKYIPGKKVKRENSVHYQKSGARYRGSPPSSRSSSDSEDYSGKRSQHNDMERKRRIDLKYSFLRLRDQVPELFKHERAPKVTILKKASEYIHQLRKNESALEMELDKLKDRKEELVRRLSSLRKSTWF